MRRRFVWMALLAAFAVNGCGGDEPKAVTTASGLTYFDLKMGSGQTAAAGDEVEVHYTGWLVADGKKFDSSRDRGEPIAFKLGTAAVIKGWDEGIAGMKVGGKRRLVIPSKLGYGESGNGGIPGGATLKFEVELVGIKGGDRVKGAPQPGAPPAGLKTEDLEVGTGRAAARGDTVAMHYTGWLVSTGKKFDSSRDRGEPFSFQIGAGEVIKGWDLGIPGMKVGGKRRLTIPAKLAYGERGRPGIPGGADLKFDVELVAIKNPPSK